MVHKTRMCSKSIHLSWQCLQFMQRQQLQRWGFSTWSTQVLQVRWQRLHPSKVWILFSSPARLSRLRYIVQWRFVYRLAMTSISVRFISLDASVLMKSCYADIPDSTRVLCDDENYLDCKKCSGENCNVHTQREGTKCHQCSGVDCLVISGLSNLVDCQSSCYIGMNCKRFYR